MGCPPVWKAKPRGFCPEVEKANILPFLGKVNYLENDRLMGIV